LRAAADPRSLALAEEVLRLVTELYGGGLARLVDIVHDGAPTLVPALADDPLVSSLLVVHGLHPDALAVRVERALESVRPFLASHKGDVELLDIDDAVGAVRLRLLGSCDGCPSSAITLQNAVERAIVEAAPEIVIIDVEEPTTDMSTNDGTAIPITLGRKPVYETCPTELAPR
jgi:Fe-S cluster biogenesis protein NfuA